MTTERNDDPLKRVDWAAFDTRARQILTPAQFELFTTTAPPILSRNRRAIR